jgi:hypothetical protein
VINSTHPIRIGHFCQPAVAEGSFKIFTRSGKTKYNPASQKPPIKESVMRKFAKISLLVSVLALLLAACGSSVDPAAASVDAYLNALVAKDSDTLSALSCADWEPSALLELDSLSAVETRLEGLACAVVGTDGDTTLVVCQGKILTTYNGEDTELELSVRTYQVVEQGGESLVCGYR